MKQVVDSYRVAVRRLHLPPWKGKPIIAQDSDARAPSWGKREVFIFGRVTPGGAALARGCYHIVLTGLRSGSLRSQLRNADELRMNVTALLAIGSILSCASDTGVN